MITGATSKKSALTGAVILLCFMITGCGGQNARDIIGLGKRAPDEFRVVARPPLSVPPDFTLRPPSSSPAASPLAATNAADRQARNVLTGSEASAAVSPVDTAVGSVSSYSLESSADSLFLDNAGASAADPTIRAQLAEDLTVTPEEEASSDYLFDWLAPNEAEGEVLVDADAELERLQENERSGKSITEGETPSVEPGGSGPLEQLFN
jgi:hypothetical protein